MDVGAPVHQEQCHPGQVTLGCTVEQVSLSSVLPWFSRFLPWVSWATEHGLRAGSWNKPLPPQVVFIMVFITANKSCWKASNLKNSLSPCAGKGEEIRLGTERQVKVRLPDERPICWKERTDARKPFSDLHCVSPTHKNHTHLKQVGSGEEYPAGTQLYTCQFCQLCGKTRKGDPGFSIYRRYTHTSPSLTTPTNSKHIPLWFLGMWRH